MNNKYLIIILLLFIIENAVGQITIPITDNELKKYRAEKDAMVSLDTDFAQIWLFKVKDGRVSKNKLLLSEIYYNRSGLPVKVVYYGENQKPESFINIKYNNQSLPFEEIKFNSDSILISGIMYEYDDKNLLIRQTGYNNKAQVTYVNSYVREENSMNITLKNNDDEVIYRSVVNFYDKGINKHLVKSMTKVDNNTSGKIVPEYDKMSSLTKKFVYDSKDEGILKEFIYDEEDMLIKTVTYNSLNKEIQNSSYEYDDHGNISRVIEYNEVENLTTVFAINYFSRTKR